MQHVSEARGSLLLAGGHPHPAKLPDSWDTPTARLPDSWETPTARLPGSWDTPTARSLGSWGHAQC
jgi:hypothetical protein